MSAKTHWRLVCPYCDEKTRDGHVVPASLGEETFLICKPINAIEQRYGMEKKKDWLAASPVSESEPREATRRRTTIIDSKPLPEFAAVSPSEGAPTFDNNILGALAAGVRFGGFDAEGSVTALAAALLRERAEGWKDTALEYQRALDEIAAALGIDGAWGIQKSQEPGDPPNIVRAVLSERAARLVAETERDEAKQGMADMFVAAANAAKFRAYAVHLPRCHAWNDDASFSEETCDCGLAALRSPESKR